MGLLPKSKVKLLMCSLWKQFYPEIPFATFFWVWESIKIQSRLFILHRKRTYTAWKYPYTVSWFVAHNFTFYEFNKKILYRHITTQYSNTFNVLYNYSDNIMYILYYLKNTFEHVILLNLITFLSQQMYGWMKGRAPRIPVVYE